LSTASKHCADGEHGGGQRKLEEVAKKANAKYSTQGVYMFFCGDFYEKTQAEFQQWLIARYIYMRSTRLTDGIARLDRKLNRLPSARPVSQAVHNRIESNELAKDVRDEQPDYPCARMNRKGSLRPLFRWKSGARGTPPRGSARTHV
jgi:hypothetical protein